MGKELYSDARQLLREMLREARTSAKLSQVELSRLLKRPQSYVSDYERAHRRLDWVAVVEVLTACEQDLVEFAARYQTAARSAGRSSTSRPK